MASRRILKKCVNSVCEELFAACVMNAQKDVNLAKDTMVSVIAMQTEFVTRISNPQADHAYFQKFLKDFNAKIDEVVANIEKLY